MADLIRKLVTCDVKEVSDRVLQFIGSTETQDRDGEVIKAEGWDLKNYKKNPIFMWAHRYTDPPIGKAKRVWVDKESNELKFNIEFAPPETYEFADTIYKLYKGEFLKATSVGFVPDEDGIIEGDGKKTPKRTYTKQELLELSGVPVPSNPEALISARDAGVITIKEFEAITKPEETEDWIRIPVRECKVTATIDISKKEGIKALYCGKEKQVRTYMFDKRAPYNWTMAKAKKWVEDHKDSKQETYQCECIECGYKMESEKHCADIKCPKCGGAMRRIERPGPGKEGIEIEEKVITQAGVKDEIDYLKSLIEDVGLNEEAMKEAWELMRDIMRLAGNDIPEDIRDTIGVMITEQQELKVRDAIDYLEAYLDKTNVAEESEEVPIITEPKELDEARIGEILAKAVGEAILKAQGKI